MGEEDCLVGFAMLESMACHVVGCTLQLAFLLSGLMLFCVVLFKIKRAHCFEGRFERTTSKERTKKSDPTA